MSEALRLAEESTNLAERRLESDGYEWSVDADVQLRETAAELRRLAPMEAEVSQLRAEANNCGSGAGCCYQAAQNERLEVELQQARAELVALRASLGGPVAWDVYVKEADNGYLIDSLDDRQYIDDATNHGAVATPLFSMLSASPQAPRPTQPGE